MDEIEELENSDSSSLPAANDTHHPPLGKLKLNINLEINLIVLKHRILSSKGHWRSNHFRPQLQVRERIPESTAGQAGAGRVCAHDCPD